MIRRDITSAAWDAFGVGALCFGGAFAGGLAALLVAHLVEGAVDVGSGTLTGEAAGVHANGGWGERHGSDGERAGVEGEAVGVHGVAALAL